MSINPDHYVSLGVAKKLKSAGIEFGGSKIVWTREKNGCERKARWKRWRLNYRGHMCTSFAFEDIPAPSLMEIMDRLPDNYCSMRGVKKSTCFDIEALLVGTIAENQTFANTAPDACGEMLLKLKEET